MGATYSYSNFIYNYNACLGGGGGAVDITTKLIHRSKSSPLNLKLDTNTTNAILT